MVRDGIGLSYRNNFKLIAITSLRGGGVFIQRRKLTHSVLIKT